MEGGPTEAAPGRVDVDADDLADPGQLLEQCGDASAELAAHAAHEDPPGGARHLPQRTSRRGTSVKVTTTCGRHLHVAGAHVERSALVGRRGGHGHHHATPRSRLIRARLVDAHDRTEGEPEAIGVGLGPPTGVGRGRPAGLEVRRVVLLDHPLRPAHPRPGRLDGIGQQPADEGRVAGGHLEPVHRSLPQQDVLVPAPLVGRLHGHPGGRPVGVGDAPLTEHRLQGRGALGHVAQRLGRGGGGVSEFEEQDRPVRSGVGRPGALHHHRHGHGTSRSSPRSSAGADWVIALVETRSAPGRGQRRDVVEVHAARHLDQRPSGHERDAAAHLVGTHVVEHHQVGSRLDRLQDLLEPVALHLHRARRPPVPGRRHRLGDGEAGEVVVLHEHHVRQRATMVHAAARSHGGLLEGPQPGERLAGVPDARRGVGRGHGVDEAPGEGGHARQVADEVEGRPLGGEHRRQRPSDDRRPRHLVPVRPRRSAPTSTSMRLSS